MTELKRLGCIEVQCGTCQSWSPSMIQLGDKQTFEAADLSGNTQYCPTCRKSTACNKENMRWTQDDGKGGFRGVDTR